MPKYHPKYYQNDRNTKKSSKSLLNPKKYYQNEEMSYQTSKFIRSEVPNTWLFEEYLPLLHLNVQVREVPKLKVGAQIWVFSKRGGGTRPNQKFWGTFFLPQTTQKGGGVRANPKVLRQFWGSFGAVLGQNYCNISSISKGRNDFTHHQLKDYDVFSVKNLQ